VVIIHNTFLRVLVASVSGVVAVFAWLTFMSIVRGMLSSGSPGEPNQTVTAVAVIGTLAVLPLAGILIFLITTPGNGAARVLYRSDMATGGQGAASADDAITPIPPAVPPTVPPTVPLARRVAPAVAPVQFVAPRAACGGDDHAAITYTPTGNERCDAMTFQALNSPARRQSRNMFLLLLVKGMSRK
jgi:hypothetical protein